MASTFISAVTAVATSAQTGGQGMVRLLVFAVMAIVPYSIIAYLIYLLIKALRKYLRSEPVRKERAEKARTLGEVIKRRRTECKMTQEFVAEALGVSRQAVSKWESGASDPSTTNLIALAKLFGVARRTCCARWNKRKRARSVPGSFLVSQGLQATVSTLMNWKFAPSTAALRASSVTLASQTTEAVPSSWLASALSTPGRASRVLLRRPEQPPQCMPSTFMSFFMVKYPP